VSLLRVGQPAAVAILECVRAACTLPTFQEGAKREQELFIPLIKGNESKALRHMFFAERACSKVHGNYIIYYHGS
jgi:3-hydroxyacyl-CoA dehydrogenase